MAVTETLTDQEKIERAYALGYEYEARHGVCPQCTIAALQDVFGIVDDETFKATHVLAGGGALSTRGTCGALVGAMMAMGAMLGRDRESFKTTRTRESFVPAKAILDAFVAKYGSPICGEVQAKIMGRSFDMWNPDDYAAFEAAGGHTDKCTDVVGTAARIAAEKIIELRKAGS